MRDAEFFGVAFVRADDTVEPCSQFFANEPEAEEYARHWRERTSGVEVRVFKLVALLSELRNPAILQAETKKEYLAAPLILGAPRE